ncbi:MAG: AAA family ATPase [Desulfobacteraceae bacterium]|nr:AAA family ATPase [Desulfobacteraceae bacterium]
MKLGLSLNVIDPSIGGLLIKGEKGTGKSTAVRSLAELLPEISVSRGCAFNCDPSSTSLCSNCSERLSADGALEGEKRRMRVVELPLGITEDRLVGALDIEHALKRGEKRFEPGILADANRNFLYVDEVNLLEDHIIDLLLDSAAMGWSTVEREGVSFSHPARFILVGTMNPEEGDLRPQLLDRFGLCVCVHSIRDRNMRVEILKRRSRFDADPEGFLQFVQSEQNSLSEEIIRARENLPNVEIPDAILTRIVEITTEIHVDGHRSDIVMLRAARALAAFRGQERIEPEDIGDIVALALNHRLKRTPFEDVESGRKKLDELLDGLAGH